MSAEVILLLGFFVSWVVFAMAMAVGGRSRDASEIFQDVALAMLPALVWPLTLIGLAIALLVWIVARWAS